MAGREGLVVLRFQGEAGAALLGPSPGGGGGGGSQRGPARSGVAGSGGGTMSLALRSVWRPGDPAVGRAGEEASAPLWHPQLAGAAVLGLGSPSSGLHPCQVPRAAPACAPGLCQGPFQAALGHGGGWARHELVLNLASDS